jgi:anti-anti-sigma factor
MLKVETKNSESVAIVSLRGEIVRAEAENLRTAVQSLNDVRAVILDLAGVSTVDAGGLGVLLELREQARARGITFELMNVSKWVGKVLQLVRLDCVFRVASVVEFVPASTQNRRVALPRMASCA